MRGFLCPEISRRIVQSRLVDSPAAIQQLQDWAARGGLRIHSLGQHELKAVVD
jgi:hypothetical protein